MRDRIFIASFGEGDGNDRMRLAGTGANPCAMTDKARDSATAALHGRRPM